MTSDEAENPVHPTRAAPGARAGAGVGPAVPTPATPALAYAPAPLDTSAVRLGGTLEDLVEALARNAHDVWARARLDAGWTWGPARDDAAKRHPCLVPYEQLPESEKDYDRRSVVETLKAMVGLGWRILPP